MTTALVRTVAPSVTPISLVEAREHCRVDHTDEDVLIESLIAAAVSHVDAQGELGRAMITQSWAQWEPQAPGWVRLDMGPFQSLTSVEYYDDDGVLQTADVADFEAQLSGDHVIIKPKDNREWPRADTRRDAIKLTYVAGFGDTPEDVPAGIRHAMLMLVAHWYENRSAVDDARMMPVPMAVEALLANERVGWYG